MKPVVAPDWWWFQMDDRRTRWVQVFGRLKPGYTAESAQAIVGSWENQDHTAEGEPSNAYGHKERCLDAYLDYAEKAPDELERWIALVPTIIQLFDKLQTTLPDHYSGRFGKIDEVRIYDERQYERGGKKYRNTPAKSQFLGQPMKYQYPAGWLYPLFAAFRHLAGPAKDGLSITWRRDPIQFWNQHGGDLVKRYEPHIRDAGYENKRIATSFICYQAMSQAVKDLYKDELLKKAGIDV
jgi:hypothetical protein